VSGAKTPEPIDLPFGLWTRWAARSTVQLYLPDGANMPTWKGTEVPPGEYDWTVSLRWWCGLMSNYCEHLLFKLTANVDVVMKSIW